MSSNFLRENKTLTNVYFKRALDNMGIGGELAPLVKTSELTGDYYIVDRNKASKPPSVNVKRAPGSKGATIDRAGREIKSFRCVDNNLTMEIPFELLRGTEEFSIVEEQMNTADQILGMIKTEHEKEVFDLAWGTDLASFQAKLGGAATPSTKWNATGATIKKSVLDAGDAMLLNCGKRPNTMVLTNEVFNAISTADNEIRDVIKYTENGMVTAQKIARYFEIETVLIPYYMDDSPTPGVSDYKAFLWTGDNVGLYYVDKQSSSRQKITFATTFYYDVAERRFMQIYTGYNEETESEEVKISAFWDVVSIDKACGYALVDVLV